MPKPNRTAATISGRIALRLNSSVKSGLVKKLMIISARPSVSPTSPSTTVYAPVTSGKIRTTMYMSSAAMPAVTTKVRIVVPMTLPARLMLCIFAIAEEMETKTIGTTTQNIRLMNTVPIGSRQVAPALTTSPEASLTAGQTAPVTQPAMMPTSIAIKNP